LGAVSGVVSGVEVIAKMFEAMLGIAVAIG